MLGGKTNEFTALSMITGMETEGSSRGVIGEAQRVKPVATDCETDPPQRPTTEEHVPDVKPALLAVDGVDTAAPPAFVLHVNTLKEGEGEPLGATAVIAYEGALLFTKFTCVGEAPRFTARPPPVATFPQRSNDPEKVSCEAKWRARVEASKEVKRLFAMLKLAEPRTLDEVKVSGYLSFAVALSVLS